MLIHSLHLIRFIAFSGIQSTSINYYQWKINSYEKTVLGKQFKTFRKLCGVCFKRSCAPLCTLFTVDNRTMFQTKNLFLSRVLLC